MNRTTFEVGTFEVNCSIVFENGKALVVEANPENPLLRNARSQQGVDRQLHHRRLSATADARNGDDFLPVDGQTDVPRQRRKRHFRLFEGNQTFEYILVHLHFHLFWEERIYESFLLARKLLLNAAVQCKHNLQ